MNLDEFKQRLKVSKLSEDEAKLLRKEVSSESFPDQLKSWALECIQVLELSSW